MYGALLVGMGVIARQSIKGALANYLGVAIGFFVSFFVLTRYLTQEEIGLTRVMVDAALLFSSLAQLGANASIVRFFPWFKSSTSNPPNHGMLGWSVLLPLAGFVLFAVAFLVFREPLLGIYAKNAPLVADYFYLMPMLTFFALYTTVFETYSSVLLRITVPKLVREVGIRLFNLAAYLLYGCGLISLDMFVWMFCGSYGLAMVLNLCYVASLGGFTLRVDRGFLDRRKVGEILRYTLFMTATVLAGNIPMFNSLFLGAKTGLALTGVYTIASYIANVVEVPYRSLGAISRPVIATAMKEDNLGEVNRLGRQVSLHQFMVSLAILYVIAINLDVLFELIPNGQNYRQGIVVVLVLGGAKALNSTLSVGTDILNYSRHYSWSLLLIGVLTLSALLFNDWFIGLFGINGAALATLCAYLLYFTLLYALLWRKLSVHVFGWGQLKMVAVMAALVGVYGLWTAYLDPLLGMGLIVGAVVRTLVLGGLLLVAVLAWKVSPTVNAMVETLPARLKKKGGGR